LGSTEFGKRLVKVNMRTEFRRRRWFGGPGEYMTERHRGGAESAAGFRKAKHWRIREYINICTEMT